MAQLCGGSGTSPRPRPASEVIPAHAPRARRPRRRLGHNLASRSVPGGVAEGGVWSVCVCACVFSFFFFLWEKGGAGVRRLGVSRSKLWRKSPNVAPSKLVSSSTAAPL